MRNLLLGLVTNRFGIVLATLNVCYFVSRKFVHFAFSHGGGDHCLFMKHHIFFWIKWEYTKTIFMINLPASVASALPSKALQVFLPDLCIYTQAQFQTVFLVFFITLQWLFIGWTAKKLAQIVRNEY